jgi:hypothetical protein
MWSQVLEGKYNGKPISVLVMDTEGLASAKVDPRHDMKIFTLAILTCTHFLYNSKGTIDEDSISKLHMCVELGKELKGKSGSLKASEIQELMPNFTWVVRDFNLELLDEGGTPISQD